MAYNLELAKRLEMVCSSYPNMEAKKMFGGLGYLLNGNMCVGIHKNNLILRLGLELSEPILTEPYVKPMNITGKIMKGWVMVDPNGFNEEEQLERFIELAESFVRTLPSK